MNATSNTITPIDYGCNVNFALDRFNAAKNTKLWELDARIISTLATASTGIAAMKLRGMCSTHNKNIFSATWNTAINRLISLEYISRVKRSKYVYYYITIRGHAAYAQLNSHLIAIVEQQFAARNKLNR